MEARLPLSHCTQCEHPLDSGFDMHGSESVPTEGDLSVCIHCGNLMVYRADQTLRTMTAAEFQKLDPDMQRDLDRARAAVDMAHIRKEDHLA